MLLLLVMDPLLVTVTDAVSISTMPIYALSLHRPTMWY